MSAVYPLATIPPWVDEALCAQVDPEAWFPPKGGNNRPAKAICGDCPVRDLCGEYAITEYIDDGIWGGLSVRERRAIRTDRGMEAQRREIKHGTPGGYREHHRRKEPMCDACRDAESVYKARQRRRQQEAA